MNITAPAPIRWVNEAPERHTQHVYTGTPETSGPRVQRLLTPADRVLVWNADRAYTMRLARVGIDDHGDVSLWFVRQTVRGTDWKREAGWLMTGISSLRRWGTPGNATLADDLEAQAAQLLAVWDQVDDGVDDEPAEQPAADGPAPLLPGQYATLTDAEAGQPRASVERLAELADAEHAPRSRGRSALIRDHARTVLARLDELEARVRDLDAQLRAADEAAADMMEAGAEQRRAAQDAAEFQAGRADRLDDALDAGSI